jgi:hypothetical protein
MKQLEKNIKELSEILEKQNSFKMVVLRGVVFGLGSAIGATVIAGLVLVILGATINTIEELPLIGKWFTEATLFDEAMETADSVR